MPDHPTNHGAQRRDPERAAKRMQCGMPVSIPEDHSELGVLSLLSATFALAAATAAPGKGVQVVADEANRRVDITIDGRPLPRISGQPRSRSRCFIRSSMRTALRSRVATLLSPRGERIDHPHHAGLWFNYGNVNGFDFWNNSDAIKPENRAKMGTVNQTRIVSTRAGRTVVS